MYFLSNKSNCSGCQACFNICPVNAIQMQEDEQGFLYPLIDDMLCTHCSQCESVCPAIYFTAEKNAALSAYGCYSKDTSELMSSSSGGVFALLARKILSEGGAVCGAAFDENQRVFHILIDDESQLIRLKGTKYVQSEIGNCFTIIKTHLENGQKVLFSGMACQVEGLKNFLGREYDYLYCIDLICHGVPSPGIWKQYLKEIAGANTVKSVSFRNKTKGMDSISVDYTLSNGETITEPYKDSLYIKGFLQNIIVRPSCFDCIFKGDNRCSDLTIGDFWSMKEYHPDAYQDKGVSAVIIRTEKGKDLFKKVRPKMITVPSTVDKISLWNECLNQSVLPHPIRDDFFKIWRKNSVMELLKEYTEIQYIQSKHGRNSFSRQLRRIINRVIRKTD